MIRKMICLGVLCLMVMPLLAEDLAGAPLDKKVGYALLDAITNQFREMAISGSSPEKVDKALQTFMADAKKAKEQKQVDQVFFARYRRMVAVMKLALIPDPEGILGSVAEQEIAHFVQDVLGEEKKPGPSVGQMAWAISEEILNLHLYLDDFETKEKLREAFNKKFSDAKPKKEADKQGS